MSSGMVGFVCPRDNEDRDYNYCIRKCDNRCYSLPLLITFMQNRRVKPWRYGVTEILNPHQIVYLSRHNRFYASPEGMVWMPFGSAWHKVIESSKQKIAELGMSKDYVFELPRETTFQIGDQPVTLSGRADLWMPKTKELWDFKTAKAYFVKQVRKSWKETTYHLQLNIYKRYFYPSATSLKLEVLVKDWSKRVFYKDKVNPIEQLDAPILPAEEVNGMVTNKLAEIVEIEHDTTKMRPCTRQDQWGGMRCKNYCDVAGICPQFKRESKP